MNIPVYPKFTPIQLEMRQQLHPRLSMLKHGISEFTFANLYLFRSTYDYHLTWLPNETICISGKKNGEHFFMLPCGLPEEHLLDKLFSDHDYLKNVSEEDTKENRILLEKKGYFVSEDRDNFDYLYYRKDLATLSGKKYHKKRNLVNAFINNYEYEEKPLKKHTIADAFWVLDEWKKTRNGETDYTAAKEGLEMMDLLNLQGYIYYVNGTAAAYTLGEPLARGRIFAIHFEKAIGGYKGIYQFINQAFAAVLPRHYTWLNREQDLGDPGLRQAKMTYRPYGFVKKYKVEKHKK